MTTLQIYAAVFIVALGLVEAFAYGYYHRKDTEARQRFDSRKSSAAYREILRGSK